jgi:hypothetical protein
MSEQNMGNNSQHQNGSSEKKNLIMAIVAGMCGDAILSWMTMNSVEFSIFPFIALALALHYLYQEYLRQPVSEDFPLIGLACFFVGAFGHSAFIKALYPGAGSNFFSILIALVLMLWVGKKIGFLGKVTQ